jgi:hypothetical protein
MTAPVMVVAVSTKFVLSFEICKVMTWTAWVPLTATT